MTDKYEADREELRALKTIFEKAVENNTIEDIRAFAHPDFSFVSFTDKSFDDFDSFKKQWNLTREKMIGTGSFTATLDPNPTLFVSDVAIASGNATNNMVNSNGEEFTFDNHWTVVFQKMEGEWKVIRAHNSLDPFANPMLVSGVKRKVTKLSLIAFLAGAVLSSISAYIFLS